MLIQSSACIATTQLEIVIHGKQTEGKNVDGEMAENYYEETNYEEEDYEEERLRRQRRLQRIEEMRRRKKQTVLLHRCLLGVLSSRVTHSLQTHPPMASDPTDRF